MWCLKKLKDNNAGVTSPLESITAFAVVFIMITFLFIGASGFFISYPTDEADMYVKTIDVAESLISDTGMTTSGNSFWEENPDDVKIGCLPAVIVPWKLKEITGKSEKRILIDACGVQCGAKLIEREGMPVDRYIELTSTLHTKKVKQLPSKDLEDKVYKTIQKEVDALLGKGEAN